MSRMPEAGETFGGYRIERRLGHGGMGVVYLAHDLRVDRRVALKVISGQLADDEEFRDRFQREATVLAELDSPHIITIYDHGEYDERPFIATQYVAGGDLGSLIRTHGVLPPRLAASICAQVAGALADAHRAGVVHRDVKPANVLLRDPDDEDLIAYLCDFGVAQLDRVEDTHGLTATGSVPGTWAYLAPERTQGAKASPASDIYAAGCLLWALLTGRTPYSGNDVEVAIAHRDAPVPQLPGTDATTRRLNAVLARAMAKAPAARYPDADALRGDLLAVGAAGHTAHAPTSVRVPAPQPPPGASPAMIAGLVALVVLLLAGAGTAAYLLTRPDDTGRTTAGAPSDEPSARLTDSGRAEVTAAATEGLEAALSIDYRAFDKGVEVAAGSMSDAYAEEFRKVSGNVKEEYERQKRTVVADVKAIGITSGAKDRAEVLAVLEQTTETMTGEPVGTTTSQVWASMVPSDDTWLIDDLQVSMRYTGAPEPDAERQAAMDAASEFVDLLVELDYRNLDERETQLSKLMADDIDGVTLDQDQRATVQNRKVVVSGDPLQAGVIELQGGQATVLVTWRGSHTDTGASERDVAQQFRLTMHLIDDEWRVFQLEGEL